MKRHINNILSLFSSSEKALEKRNAESRKNLIRLFSRGNICLQQGFYLTEEDINAKRKLILSHKF